MSGFGSVGTFRPPLRPVSVAQKNKPSTMSSSNVQSIDLPMDCTAWRFWAMRQPNGCSTPSPNSSAAKQWIKEELAHKKMNCLLGFVKQFEPWICCVFHCNHKLHSACNYLGLDKSLVLFCLIYSNVLVVSKILSNCGGFFAGKYCLHVEGFEQSSGSICCQIMSGQNLPWGGKSYHLCNFFIFVKN